MSTAKRLLTLSHRILHISTKKELMKNVIKRSGKIEPLTKKKIFDSICNANSAVQDQSEQLTRKQIIRITDTVFEFCQDLDEPIDIDVLEDVIEKKLMEA